MSDKNRGAVVTLPMPVDYPSPENSHKIRSAVAQAIARTKEDRSWRERAEEAEARVADLEAMLDVLETICTGREYEIVRAARRGSDSGSEGAPVHEKGEAR